jgi:hypothetical protein
VAQIFTREDGSSEVVSNPVGRKAAAFRAATVRERVPLGFLFNPDGDPLADARGSEHPVDLRLKNETCVLALPFLVGCP